MTMKRLKLIAARSKRGWSQQALADHVQATQKAVNAWENAKATPHSYHQGKLCELLGVDDPEDLLKITEVPDPPPENGKTAHLLIPQPDWIASSITLSLLSIAHTNYPTLADLTHAVQSALKDFDMQHMGDIAYQATRREAMQALATLPLITLGKTHTAPAHHYEEALKLCTAALEGCWQLYRGSDPTGTQRAFDCVSAYLPMLETIAKDSGQHRKQAIDLAARYALLKTLLGWRLAGRETRIGYAQNALDLSKESGDILLQLSATTKLNWTYLTARHRTKAWETMQMGEFLLKDYQHKKNGPSLPSGIIGNFYNGYALSQAENGIDPDRALGIVCDNEALEKSIALIQFTESDRSWEVARTYCSKGDSAQAIAWVGKLIDLETLAPRSDVAPSENERIGAINTLTHALLQSPKRDMDQVVVVWMAEIEGAKALKHEIRYEEALNNFAMMRILWPQERRITTLAPLTAHW